MEQELSIEQQLELRELCQKLNVDILTEDEAFFLFGMNVYD